ncbi:alpha-glucan family phosphorylase [Methylophaga pinxianii]|jgi:glycogen phosphorylase|uniref:alpha-glucan family phosphorylase n=1 Tax=Methylophaga pinxianii TaxID=2881052 RepID=UPI001CF5F89B|nr:alpha-glucan family phosphorylase [Methylophaga pinxianii]MCB2426229.1 alpha-glucan family phosphorylase [Methylophaga pinxianii]UPH47271.1 alpha-glucan family phosphorylase [Methylophaga pinxianii]
MLDEFTHGPRVAYFSMEIALRNEIPTYAGGLGVLAGDTVRSAADLMIPMVAVSLVSRAGYFHQQIDAQGRQVAQAVFWEPERWTRALDAKIAVPIDGRTVWVGAWLYVVEGHMGGRQPVLLLDTDLNENHPEDREITHYLYGGDTAYRLKQEIVLGIGGLRMLQALGVTVRHYHMNEGHSALLGLELLRWYTYPTEDVRPGESHYNLPRVRDLCSFTTHTPIEAGHDRFSYELVQRVLDSDFDIESIKHLAGEDNLNMTRLALNLSEYVNGVAKKHAEVSNAMFPGYRVHAITNGVHPFTWAAESFRQLYNHYLPGWCHEPQLLMRADCCIPDAAIWESHVQAKQYLIKKVQAITGVSLDPKLPIIGYARRMTAYKRPGLLFSDIERLKKIARHHPFQVVLAGKAHAHDENGKHLIEQLYAHARDLAGTITVIYLPEYNIELAQALTAGADVWLNTPLPPLEASGTSGMKAALNGVPSLSILDGWWMEGCIEGVTGWAIGDGMEIADGDGHELYDKLEQVVFPLYYSNDRSNWIKVMKGAISKNASYFNSHRMMRRYATEAYIR